MRPGPWHQQAALLGSLLLWSLSLRSQSHKDFFPLDASDYLGFVLAIGSLLVAAGGGIGGGALLVPIFIIVFGARLGGQYLSIVSQAGFSATVLGRIRDRRRSQLDMSLF